MSAKWAPIEESTWSKNTLNPIRAIVDSIKKPENPRKEIIPLSLGDPTVYGDLRTPDVFVDAIIKNARSAQFNGYDHSAGIACAREAVAKRQSTETSPLVSDDVILASGCSGALEIAIKGLLSAGDNIILPRPGFSLYETLAKAYGVECRFYSLKPENSWEADCEEMSAQIDDRTKAILINNPSNPCGCVYSKEHLQSILAVAEKHQVPIIADEIYGNITFEGHQFHPVASLTTEVPVLSVGGIAKEFLVPGWRVGWILIHDRNGAFTEVRKGLMKLTQLIIGANTLVQSAMPAILTPEGASQKEEVEQNTRSMVAHLENNAKIVIAALGSVDGLDVVPAQGAMYVMCGIDKSKIDIVDDMAFTQQLLDEEFVVVLPGKCFGMPNYFRIFLGIPPAKLTEACSRIADFARSHTIGGTKRKDLGDEEKSAEPTAKQAKN